ncbi:flavodoxin [Bacillus glycinifermentans]|uniref:Flavodoxin n=1 Tax=Bacillus glycinifermentans TaxID=1664069 RepID=A0A0J6EYT8_9BACI|nr:flavodoxin [Bacillus glycinifermentans]ATH91231.1 flavodoxin [Bacillus glycinifermentans]KMM61829.1 flavodoxin [Bacillus glycinifermentans]KRT93486.1 flavodoxin [Bacillus glycinifermentans]MBU8788271.1 flavodoxin [Bacillus glycinifermentans]MEC0485470.1 flavodoxin [Bacillus glycinifermentans]
MGNVLLVYASMSGNTEAMADLIEKGLLEGGAEVDRHEAMDIDASLFNDYRHIVLGAYTWGDGDLPDEFLDLYEEMEDLDFSGRTFAVFGSGDTSYEHFCGAVDILEKKIAELGGEIALPSVKIEMNPEGEEEAMLLEFGRAFAGKAGVKQ